MENGLIRPDPGERHFTMKKNDQMLNLNCMIKDNDTIAVEGAFDCYADENERSLGYTLTDREGEYSIYIPKPPDYNGLIGFEVKAGKEQPEEIDDNQSLKKASVQIKSMNSRVFQGQTCIMSEGFERPDSHQEEQYTELRQNIVQREGKHSAEDCVPGQERILDQENEPLKKASVQINYISVNVIQYPFRKTSEGFGHPGGCKGKQSKQLREDSVKGECSEEECMSGEEEILDKETVNAQAEQHTAEPNHVAEADESEYRQPDLEQTLTDEYNSNRREKSDPYLAEYEQNIPGEKGPDMVAGSYAPLESLAPKEDKVDYIKACMEEVSGVHINKILTCMAFLLVGVALFRRT